MGSKVMTEDSCGISMRVQSTEGKPERQRARIRVGSRRESRQTRAGLRIESTKVALEHSCEAAGSGRGVGGSLEACGQHAGPALGLEKG